MDVHCHHRADSDMENLLLDDENTDKSCLKCRKNQGKNGHVQVDFSSGKLILEDSVCEDHHSEDSPLLINVNDCFRESLGDAHFHCHNSLVTIEDSNAFKRLIWASLFCFIFMIAELIGGYLADSLAVMTDAAHLFSDLIGFLISILALWLAKKSSTKYMNYGYYRAEVVGAFLSVLTIWFLAAVFLVLALKRLYKEEYNIDADAMIIVASLGLVVNIVMGAILHGVCHTHSHGGVTATATSDNINVRAAAAHVLGDLLQSVGVLIAATVVKIFPDAQAADPICTLVFSVIIIFTTARVARDSVWLLMQGSPIGRDKIVLELRKIVGVKHIHDVNIWALSPGRNIVTVHLAVDDYCDKDFIVQSATTLIKSQIPVFSCTVQVENYLGEEINVCKQCRLREC
ncbi:proton-coupled zinc antiporter SLC30A2-like isoform X1 [Rhynchophorus ferrugineus]|uniref:proton-coupled zinc antiporter SLC30A2-like isoform X1 n=1 Tax=Rhynchophorus ferrugineus TaxID=354439 RepID=UPI003FCDA6F9